MTTETTEPTPPMRVLIADDHGLFRDGLRSLLEARGIEVVGEARTGREAVALARELRPDVVLMDVRMPRMDGLEATTRITGDAALPDTRIIVLTTFELDEYVFGALRAGASGFLLKDIDPPDLLAAVRIVSQGDALLAPRLTRRLIEAFVAQERAAPPAVSEGDALEELTPREREVLTLLADGLNGESIAVQLVLSPDTVRTHVRNAMEKLGARTRTHAIVLALRTGEIAMQFDGREQAISPIGGKAADSAGPI